MGLHTQATEFGEVTAPLQAFKDCSGSGQKEDIAEYWIYSGKVVFSHSPAELAKEIYDSGLDDVPAKDHKMYVLWFAANDWYEEQDLV